MYKISLVWAHRLYAQNMKSIECKYQKTLETLCFVFGVTIQRSQIITNEVDFALIFSVLLPMAVSRFLPVLRADGNSEIN